MQHDTICFYARSGLSRIFAYVGKRCEDSSIKTCYIVHHDKEYRHLQQSGCQNRVYNLTQYLRNNWENHELLASIDLEAIEQQYQIDSLWSILFTDRFLIYYDYDDVIKFMKLHIAFYLEIIEKEKITFFVNENIATFSAYIFYLLGLHHKVHYMGTSEARNYSDKKFYFTDDEHSTNYLLDRYYKKRQFSEAELHSGRQFIQEYRKTKAKPEYMNIYGRKPAINIALIKGVLRYPLYLLKKKDFFDYMSYKDKDASPLKRLKFYMKYQYHKKYYKRSIEGEQFYLFGLHFQPEATTLVNAQNYEKQFCAIDMIAKKIPIHAKLYVKEHYSDLGHRELHFYEKLKAYPNVRLINPWENSRDLIEKSLGVIALSGTIGWEAILLQKPVFLLGNMFYSSFKYTNKIDNIDDLSHSLVNHKMLHSDLQEYNDELEQYAAAYLKSLQEGSFIHYGQSISLSQENRENIYESFINELERLVQEKKI